ncbi:MAG: gamma-glutamylcyclotransferase family protein [Woeseiaceae bacterium]
MKRLWQGLTIIVYSIAMAATTLYLTDSVAEEEQVLHFGYGSNMSEAYMKQYTPGLQYVMNAELPNFEIQFRKYSENMGGGISSIIEKPGSMIYGVLYWIPKKEIEELDILEDVPLGIYKRETFQVLGEDGVWYAADLYRVTEPKGPFAPAKKYLDLMIAGATEHGINAEWLAKLKEMRANRE